ncbi:MAG TPA: glycosyltransferase family 2 protein [Mucilaginibacter sp.]|nr:glycosyltransferase family 2 protein [Mucilaginibacter sp.]
MNQLVTSSENFDDLKLCVVIPTYNNARTLSQIITDVAKYTSHIIVVNDGSTDDTAQILQGYPSVQLVSYQVNVGKGWALRKAFKYAISKDYDYAITIDSDGQHFAKDLPAFIEKSARIPDALIVGARNMDQENIPGKSSFGHKFSNFWFKVETGIDCPDTQSGFRLYPLRLLKDSKFFTRKYEFEIEVLVRAAWKGIPIESVPVTVHYEPKETRVSHFRPFQDFSRVSILNTFLVIIAFAYIKPRDFLRLLFGKKKVDERSLSSC